jgi:hypothetical protein
VHWSMADPSNPAVPDDESYPAFQEVATELAKRTRFLLFTLPANNYQQEMQSHA